MITSRQVNVNLRKLAGKHGSVTTKQIELQKVKTPDEGSRPKPVAVSTAMIGDLQGKIEKKERDAVMKQRKAFNEKTGEFTVKGETVMCKCPIVSENEKDEEKKPWNKMNAKERKEYQIKNKKGGKNG